MKKVLALALALSMVFVLVSCSSFGTVKKNMTDAGYTYVENDEDTQAKIDEIVADMNEELGVSVKPHAFTIKDGLKSGIALVLEFGSSEEALNALSESETLKGFVKDAQKSDYVNGNCVLVPLGLPTGITTAVNAFQGR